MLVGCQKTQQPEAISRTTTNGASVPQNLSLEDLVRRIIEGRGVEAVIRGSPVVNYAAMYQAMVNAARPPR
jgi:hypothetical protein